MFSLLKNEWADAEWLLQEYRDLFSDGERLKLLNRLAGGLLALLQRALWENLLLRVARLTDPVRTGGHTNLTFQQLPDFFKEQRARHSELNGEVESAVAAAQFARDWRNRRIGHRDLSHALDDQARPLETASLQRVDKALASIHRVLQIIYSYEGPDLARQACGAAGTGAADEFYRRTLKLVVAVQAIDALIDPDGTTEPSEPKPVAAFLAPFPSQDGMFDAVRELRYTAKRYPRQPYLLARRIRTEQRARRNRITE